jgi:hypothetical protein
MGVVETKKKSEAVRETERKKNSQKSNLFSESVINRDEGMNRWRRQGDKHDKREYNLDELVS